MIAWTKFNEDSYFINIVNFFQIQVQVQVQTQISQFVLMQDQAIVLLLYLYYDERRDIQWNIAWALGKAQPVLGPALEKAQPVLGPALPALEKPLQSLPFSEKYYNIR